MGIDIGFLGNDLAHCGRAECSEHRRTLVGFAEELDGQSQEVHRLDTPLVRRESAYGLVNEGRIQLAIEVRFLANPQHAFRPKHEKTPFAATVNQGLLQCNVTLVGREGVEPSRSFLQRILSPQRLPFRHRPIDKGLIATRLAISLGHQLF